MATLDFSQLSKIWKVTAAGVGITFLAVGGTFWVNRVQNSAGITTRTEYSDGRTTQSGELLVKSGSLAVRLQANGDVNAQGTVSGNHLYAGTLSGAGLTDCDADNQTVAWDATTQRFGCGDDDTGAGGSAWSNTGSLQTYFDPRYVNTAGDTMTGKLLINLTTGTDALEVVQTASASKLHANTLLTVSGSVVVEDNLNVDGLMSFVGYSANPQLTAADTTTGLHFDGPGITSIHNGGIQTMLLSSTNNVGIGDSAPETKLEVDGTVSGTVLYGLQSLRSSGALTWEGDGSGASLYLGTFLKGAGLTDCDIAGISKLLWDTTTGRFSCGTDTDTNTTYTAGKGLTLTSTAFSTNDTLTGTMLRFLTVSGSLVYGKSTLASSGTIVAEGAISGASLYSATSFRGSGLVDCDIAGTSKLLWDTTTGRFSCGTDTDTNTTYTAGKGLTLTSTAFSTNDTLTGTMLRFLTVSGSLVYGKTTLASSGTLVVEGAMSGASLFVGTSIKGSGLVDCQNATTSKLLWNATTGRFSCGTDTDTNTTYTAGQGLTLTSTSFRLNASHSGTVIWAGTTLRSSGGLVVESTTSGATAYFGSLFIGKPALSTNTKLDVLGTISGALITQHGAGNNFFAGNVGIGKTPTTKLEVVGTISGSTVRATTLSGNVIRGGQFSQRQLSMEIFASGSTITTGSGKAFMTVPWSMSGYLLSRAWVSVGTGGYTGSTSVQVRNAEKGFRKLFSTPLTLDDRRFGSGQVVIDSNTREVGALDRLFFDIPTVTTTAPKSPMVILLDFYKP